jgi:hypothetical protein
MYIIAHWNGHGIRVGCIICGEGFELVFPRGASGADHPPGPGVASVGGPWPAASLEALQTNATHR